MELLGVGGHGRVYQYKNYTALKYIPKCNLRGITCFMELYISTYLKCPYLNTAKASIDGQGNIKLVQPLAIGDLQDYPLPGCREWCWQLVCAVGHLHAGGILHGDIKPANILIFTNNQIKLTDFSLSMPVTGVVTSSSFVPYTPPFRPPETSWSYPADIWALGATFQYLHKGHAHPLFERMTHPDPAQRPTIWTIANDPFFDTCRHPEEFPEVLHQQFPVRMSILEYICKSVGDQIPLYVCQNVCQKIERQYDGIYVTKQELKYEVLLCKLMGFHFLPTI